MQFSNSLLSSVNGDFHTQLDKYMSKKITKGVLNIRIDCRGGTEGIEWPIRLKR